MCISASKKLVMIKLSVRIYFLLGISKISTMESSPNDLGGLGLLFFQCKALSVHNYVNFNSKLIEMKKKNLT